MRCDTHNNKVIKEWNHIAHTLQAERDSNARPPADWTTRIVAGPRARLDEAPFNKQLVSPTRAHGKQHDIEMNVLIVRLYLRLASCVPTSLLHQHKSYKLSLNRF